MLKFKSLAVKNFLSVGNVSQAIVLDHADLVLVLGENLDMGGNDYRNGVGKTTIINALSYALYGKTISDIKISNLINKTNKKNMVVSVHFSNNGNDYYIERARKPDKLTFKINNKDYLDSDTEDSNEANGENRITQEAIERAIGVNYLMFKHIVALNTYTDPFLKMSGPEQRQIIEQLLGITMLSEKADILSKQYIKTTKTSIKEQELKIAALINANKHIETNINSILLKSTAWETNKTNKIAELTSAATKLLTLDIDTEIENHKLRAKILESNRQIQMAERELQSLKSSQTHISALKNKLEADLDSIETHSECPECKQQMESHSHVTLLHEKTEKLKVINAQYEEITNKVTTATETLSSLGDKDNTAITLFYPTLEDALAHKSKIDSIGDQLETIMSSSNPYVDQADMLRDGIVEPDYDEIDKLTTLLEHQEFLLKLLINKDSFIRKKIINQNLAFLNSRLEYYLTSINLPHTVVFMPDMSVEIMELGRDLDFDNLSRGERTRLTLSLALAFRDTYESLNGKIDLLFVDELIDTGLDPNGVESCLNVLKQQNRSHSKSVFLISHRDELIGRVSNVLKVIKDGGFTMFDSVVEVTD